MFGLYPHFPELLGFVEAGMCKRRRHPSLPIWIYNYSQKAQFEFTAESWPGPLRDARGLVLDDNGHVVARGLRKFFNLSQLTALPQGLPEFWEKADGSLILVFQYHGVRVCSTRGSFDSVQAAWATGKFAAIYPDLVPEPGITFCFEAIYPENRIVVDYAGREELVVLAAIDARTGADHDAAIDSLDGRFRRATFFGRMNAAEVPSRGGEGFVLRWPDGTRAKVKLDEYTRLHRMIYGTSTKTVWELLRAGKRPEDETAILPQEMHGWIHDTAEALRARHAGLIADRKDEFEQARGMGLVEGPRAQFAEWAKKQKYPALLFKLLDGRPITDEAWRIVEPEFQKPSWAVEPEE